MSLPVIADVWRVAFDWVDANGTHAVNVMHFKQPTGTAGDLAASLSATWQALQGNFTPAATKVRSFNITKLDGTSASQEYTPTSGKWTGGLSTGGITIAPSCIVKLTTAKRGRSYRGRIFLPFVGESAQEAGLLDGGYLIDLQAAWSAWMTAMSGRATPADLVVASYLHSTAEVVTGIHVETALGTQRRRQSRVRGTAA